MNQRKVLTKVLAVAAILYGMSRLDGLNGAGGRSGLQAKGLEGEAGAASVPGPDIYFAETTFNYGNVAQDAKVHHVFQFQNRGTSNLEIGEVRGSCGCTAALATEKIVAPGASGSIDVTFDTRGKKGKNQKTVSVSSNDPDSPVTTLILDGTIDTFVEMDPSFVAFGNNLPKGQAAEQKLRLWRPDGQSFQILKIESDSAVVKAVAAPFTDGARTGQELTVTLGANAEPGRYSGMIRVSTDIPQALEQTVRFYGSVHGDVSVTPKYAILGSVAVGQEASKTVTIQTTASGPALEILKVTDPSATVKSSLKTIEDGRRYELTVTITKDAPQGSVRGEILLETNLEDEKTLHIPVYGFVGNQTEADGKVQRVEPGQ